MELTDKLAGLQTEDYDAIDIQGQPPDWREGAAVFASKTAGAGDGVDVAALIPVLLRISTQIVKEQSAPAPEVVDLAHQSAGGLYHGPALRVQVSGQIRQQLLCRGVGDREISSQGGQHSHLSSCSIQ